jgi:hypothetical protein
MSSIEIEALFMKDQQSMQPEHAILSLGLLSLVDIQKS